MTKEEAIAILSREIDEDPFLRTEYREQIHEALKMAIKALEQQESDDFARWVAREIFDEMWEYNKDAFAEIACRKLAKLGIVRSTGHEWELVEQEPCEDAISRTGRWIDNNNGAILCNYCHTWFNKDNRYSYMHYCPNCGAKMVKGRNEE